MIGARQAVAFTLLGLALAGCVSDGAGTDTGNATCVFQGCSSRARATTPDGLHWRGFLMYASRDGIYFNGAAVDEGPGRCAEKGGSLVIQFSLVAALAWTEPSGDLRLTWQASAGPSGESAIGARWCSEIRPTVLATDVTLSPDGHLRATAAVTGWPATQTCLVDGGGPDGDAPNDADAGADVVQTITVEGPLDFSLPDIPTGYCNGNSATLIAPTDGGPMVFPCHSTWSDPSVFVVPGRCPPSA